MNKCIVGIGFCLFCSSFSFGGPSIKQQYYDGVLSSEDIKGYNKMLRAPLYFRKAFKAKKLENLASYLVAAAIERADDLGLFLFESAQGMRRVQEFYANSMTHLEQEQSKSVKRALRAALYPFFTQISADYVRLGRMKLTGAQKENLLDAQLDVLNEKYKKIIKAIQNCKQETKMPSAVTLEALIAYFD